MLILNHVEVLCKSWLMIGNLPLIQTCAYQGVRNVIFSENFTNVLNEWSLYKMYQIQFTQIMLNLSKLC